MVSAEYLEAMKSQKFGIEIEFSFITRPQARETIRQFFGNHDMLDWRGRAWKIVMDGSVRAKKRLESGEVIEADENYKVELNSPILEYEDFELLSGVLSSLRHRGAEISDVCGLHIHVGEEGHTARSLRNLLNLFMQKEKVMQEAFQIDPYRLNEYCQTVSEELIPIMNRRKKQTLEKLEEQWQQFDSSRYRMLNLDSFFDHKGIEFRLFNATLDPDIVKAYVIFCLAVSQKAKTMQRAVPIKSNMENNRYEWRNFLNRLGLAGDEFKEVRRQLMRYVSGDSSFHDPESHGRRRLIKGF